MTLQILLATYNSGRYLRPLLDSLFAQSFEDFTVLARDDGSTDDTRDILASCTDARLQVLPDHTPSGSAQGNFFLLLEQSDADYIMFADADDVWLPEKVARTLARIQAMEQQYGPDCPLLVHGDLAVVDEQLGAIAPSLFRYEKISPARTALRQLLSQNNVTGCTVMINRALHALVPVRPQHSVMHDWWLALIASAFGHIGVLEGSLILYRQHGHNEVGASNAADLGAAARKFQNRARMRAIYTAMYEQAGCFADTFSDKLSPADLATARAYAAMKGKGKFGKVAAIVSNRFYKNTLLRNLGQLLIV